MTELADTTGLELWQSADAELMLAAAEATMRAYCGWHVYPPRDDTVVLDGSGTSLLLLPSLHVTAIASITETAVWGDPTDVDLDDGAVQWSADGRILRACRWTSRLRGVEVSFTHGYDDVPLDLQAVLFGLVAVRSASGGAVMEQVGPFRMTMPSTVPDGSGGVLNVAATLARFKLPPVA